MIGLTVSHHSGQTVSIVTTEHSRAGHSLSPGQLLQAVDQLGVELTVVGQGVEYQVPDTSQLEPER